MVSQQFAMAMHNLSFTVCCYGGLPTPSSLGAPSVSLQNHSELHACILSWCALGMREWVVGGT